MDHSPHRLLAAGEEGPVRRNRGQGVLAAHGDAALAPDVLEVADHEHLEVDFGIDGRAPSAARAIVGSAEFADDVAETLGLEMVGDAVAEARCASHPNRAALHPELVLDGKGLLADPSEK